MFGVIIRSQSMNKKFSVVKTNVDLTHMLKHQGINKWKFKAILSSGSAVEACWSLNFKILSQHTKSRTLFSWCSFLCFHRKQWLPGIRETQHGQIACHPAVAKEIMYVIPANNMLLMPSFPLSSFLRYSSPELNSDNVHCELMETFLF